MKISGIAIMLQLKYYRIAISGIKRPGLDTNNSLLPIAEVKNG
jgi:hypothetical protein